jgi:MFS family permease
VFVEARVAREPLIPLSIFRYRQLRAANLVGLLMYGANFPAWFFITLYLQQVLHFDAIEAGLAFLPMTLSIFAGSTLAPRVVARFGARRVITAGMVSMLAGMLWLSQITPGGSYVTTVLGGALLTALGMGFSLVPSTIVSMQDVTGEQSGIGSGLLNTSRLMGGALGLAFLSTIASSQSNGETGVRAARAITDGFDLAFAVAAVVCVGAVIISATRLQGRTDPVTQSIVESDVTETEARARARARGGARRSRGGGRLTARPAAPRARRPAGPPPGNPQKTRHRSWDFPRFAAW